VLRPFTVPLATVAIHQSALVGARKATSVPKSTGAEVPPINSATTQPMDYATIAVGRSIIDSTIATGSCIVWKARAAFDQTLAARKKSTKAQKAS